MAQKKSLLPEWTDVLGLLDVPKIVKAIEVDPKDNNPFHLDDEKRDVILDMIWSAGEKWVPWDLVNIDILSVEDKFEMTYKVGNTVKGYLDVEGTIRGLMEPYVPYKDKLIIIDWKTTKGELDIRWKNRLLDSWQWRIYAGSTGASLVEYRGISRKCDNGGCDTRSIIIEVPNTTQKEVAEYTAALVEQRDRLIELGYDVWPRNMPNACNKYNRLCPFKDDCDSYSMPRFVPDPGKIMSYTEFDRFMLCPEKSRRLSQAAEVEDDDEELVIGGSFHAGMAELYKQVKEIKLNA